MCALSVLGKGAVRFWPGSATVKDVFGKCPFKQALVVFVQTTRMGRSLPALQGLTSLLFDLSRCAITTSVLSDVGK